MIQLNKPYYYENLIDDAKLLENTYDQLIQSSIIGKTHDQRDIIMLKVGNGKKNLILTGGVHGRESINPIVLMRMIEFYCIENFKFLQEYSFYFIPLVNPDGYMVALRGFDALDTESLRIQAKETDIIYTEWKYNARAIDLNRNFPSDSWRPKTSSDFPASENETKALMKVFESIPSIGYIDYHSRGKTIYYYRHRMGKTYNQKQRIIAERLADDLGYSILSREAEIEENDSGGNTVHFYSEYTSMPAITIETVDEEEDFPLNINLQENTFCEILFSPIIMLY
jgi:g-D-glutamyl-meso-diaminopimelate peptidase